MSDATANLQLMDCIQGMATLPPDSVHLAVTSIPFEELFTYSGKLEDCGNNGSTVDIEAGRFALNLRFFAEQLQRVLAPGCNACVHIQQLLAYKNQHGYMGRRDFRGSMYNVFRAAGLLPVGEFVIPKCPQIMAQRLSLHSLQFKTGIERDGCMLAPAVNDYVLIFRKEGQHPSPPKPLFDKKRNPTGWMTTDEWVRDASGIWSDINELDVLQGARDPRHKEKKEEKHVCPLQLEVIRRCIRLYTNPISIQSNVTVMDPFMGIGSTAYVALGGRSPVTKLALEEPRNVIGFELKESYHRSSLGYVAEAREQREAKAEATAGATLFDDLPDAPESFLTPIEPAAGMSLIPVSVEQVRGGQLARFDLDASPAPGEEVVAEVYSDGGVVGKNPSPAGGTWAWCHVSADGRQVAEASGHVEPSAVESEDVSNNQSEYLALLLCLESLPDGWSGKVFTDSGVTLQRFRDPEGVKMKSIPTGWQNRLKAVRNRLGILSFVLLGGHPTRVDLETGVRAKDGKPVSKWNVWCDKACGAEAQKVKSRLQPV